MLCVLLSFGKNKVAILGDIEMMFYSFENRNSLQVVWDKDSDLSKEFVEYCMTRHVFWK